MYFAFRVHIIPVNMTGTKVHEGMQPNIRRKYWRGIIQPLSRQGFVQTPPHIYGMKITRWSHVCLFADDTALTTPVEFTKVSFSNTYLVCEKHNNNK